MKAKGKKVLSKIVEKLGKLVNKWEDGSWWKPFKSWTPFFLGDRECSFVPKPEVIEELITIQNNHKNGEI